MSKLFSSCDGDRVYYWPSAGYPRPIPLKWFSPLIRVLFENKYYSSINNQDGYLRAMYGSDYMVPPLEKDRISHHTNNAFWNDIQ